MLEDKIVGVKMTVKEADAIMQNYFAKSEGFAKPLPPMTDEEKIAAMVVKKDMLDLSSDHYRQAQIEAFNAD